MLQLPEVTRQLTDLDHAGKQTVNPQRFAMRDFADLARKALHDSGYSMSAAARALNYDLAYLSRVLNRKQAPSAALARALDELTGMESALVESLEPRTSEDERMPHAAAYPSRLDGAAVRALAGALAAQRHADDVVDRDRLSGRRKPRGKPFWPCCGKRAVVIGMRCALSFRNPCSSWDG